VFPVVSKQTDAGDKRGTRGRDGEGGASRTHSYREGGDGNAGDGVFDEVGAACPDQRIGLAVVAYVVAGPGEAVGE
jgi:hypothetical protein